MNKNISKEITFKRLSILDDLSKFLILEPYLGFEVLKVDIWSISKICACDTTVLCGNIKEFLNQLDYEQTLNKLLNCIDVEQLNRCNISSNCLREHLFMYLKIIHPKSPVSVKECFRYQVLQRQV